MKLIDYRSDTVTLPTPEMREAMAKAELGDDVMREDPTVNRLEAMAANMFGAEASLLLPSGTMSNLVAAMTHCQRGDEMIIEAEAHMYYYEVGSISAIAGVIPRLIPGVKGIFSAQQVEDAIRGKDLHFPNTSLLGIENTHNRAGGTCWTPAQMAEVCRVAHDHGLSVHLDGARIFNAAVALDVDVKEYARQVDSINFCLSKGLSAPVGSMLVGGTEFINRARKNRKMVGGGMREAGIIAAPGIVALTRMVSRLQEDHDNAKTLAKGLTKECRCRIDMSTVQTNIVVADVSPLLASEFIQKAKERGILTSSFGKHLVRFVTHYGLVREDVDETLRRLAKP
jgi:threonine aldolase